MGNNETLHPQWITHNDLPRPRHRPDVPDLMLQVLRFPVTTYSSRHYQTTVGEGPAGVAIKHDEMYEQTGNLWIEVAEKARPRAGDYAPSGVFRDDNSWLYIIGNYDIVFVFAKVALQGLARSQRFRILENKTRTSQGFLLSDDVARRLAVRVLLSKAENKIAIAVGDLRARFELERAALDLGATRLFPDEVS